MNVATMLLMFTGSSGGALAAMEEVRLGLDGVSESSKKTNTIMGAVKSAVPIFAGVAAAIVGVSAVSVKMAGDFDRQMEMIITQAGAAGENIDYLKQRVLGLAGEVGYAPTELANGLYHVESAGFRGAQAIDILTASAKLAKIGQADLEDTTQAVIGVMAAYPGRFKSAADAAAYLNAIVGTGDMKMEQLDKAIATGILPTASTFGLTIRDVGAALATMTDNVTPADEAATRLRMTISMIGSPSGAAQKALAGIGITSTQLGEDLRKPDGLLAAITDLRTHLTKIDTSQLQGGVATAKGDLEKLGFSTKQVNDMLGKMGPTAVEQALILSKAFGGGKSSAAIMTLLTEYDRFKDKYQQLDEGAKQFSQDWQATQGQFNVMVDKGRAALDAMAVSYGERLLPYAQRAISAFSGAIPAIQSFVNNGLDKVGAGIQRLAPLMPGLEAAFQRFAPALGHALSGVGQALAPVLVVIPGAVLGVTAAMNGLAPVLNFVGQHANVLVPILGAVVAGFVAFRVAVGITQAVMAMQVAFRGLRLVLAGVEGAQALVNFAMSAGVERMVVMRAVTLAYQAASLIARGATMAWAAAQTILNLILTLNPIGLLIVGIGLLIAAVVLLVTHWKQVTQVVSQVWDHLKAFAAELGPKIGAAFSALGTAVHNAVTAIGNWLKANWLTLLLTALLGPLGLLVAFVITHWNQIRTAMANGAQAAARAVLQFLEHLPYLVGALIGQMVSNWINAFLLLYRIDTVIIPNLILGIIRWFGTLPGQLQALLFRAQAYVDAWGAYLLAWVETVPPMWIERFFTWLGTLPPRAQALLFQAQSYLYAWGVYLLAWVQTVPPRWITTFFTWLSQLPGRLLGVLGQGSDQLSSWGGQVASWAWNTGSNLLNNIVNAIEGLPGRLGSIASNAMSSLVNGVASAGSWVYNTAAHIASQLVQGFMDNLKIGSPSRVMREQVGHNTIDGVVVGMEDKLPAVSAAAQRISAGLVGAFGPGQLGTSVAASVAASGISGGVVGAGAPTDSLLNQILNELRAIRTGNQSPGSMAASLRHA